MRGDDTESERKRKVGEKVEDQDDHRVINHFLKSLLTQMHPLNEGMKERKGEGYTRWMMLMMMMKKKLVL